MKKKNIMYNENDTKLCDQEYDDLRQYQMNVKRRSARPGTYRLQTICNSVIEI
jgi:hypothetical protein